MAEEHDAGLAKRLAISASAKAGRGATADFHAAFAGLAEAMPIQVDRIPFAELAGWAFHPGTGNLVHDTGRFFTVESIEVRIPDAVVPGWSQPIINQPEVGILGILVKEFGGVLHCLMQAKAEPGNCNGVQLSPTVQATHSNYTRVHGGRRVPYLEYFLDADAHQVVADVLQSEQGSWFYRKRNRNMVIEVTGPVEVLDGFCWLTIGQLHQLLGQDNLLNMDSRTVLSCLPFTGEALESVFAADTEDLRAAAIRSYHELSPSRHSTREVLSWITAARSRGDVRTRRIPLAEVTGWTRDATAITHDSGQFFRIIAVDVQAGSRERTSWTQPMLEPVEVGVVAFLVKSIAGVLHVLVNACIEPGYLDVVELAPTVQCCPGNYAHLAPEARPPFLDAVLDTPPERILFDTVLSEEGGRFFAARNRYLVVEADDDEHEPPPPDFRWLTLHQLVGLLRHSHYVNVQARSLIACLHGLSARHSAVVQPANGGRR